ncbi:prephenate dehydrogenase [Affinibrenneria salicis]|uniref:Prephenate dehydrogenase n=1 Tax=Affinibrenneria salicis TaxID=2590031 RepID=A0A5J5G0J0_9GAMM|nr:primosomal replication protein [Affinibrenneria salicis]KAA9000039.1 prephenate dehydrogenase [Affinibrenneria salicis]
MNTHTLLQTLDKQVSDLAGSLEPLADRPVAQSRFDRQLFTSYGTRMHDYLCEIQRNLQHLHRFVAEQRVERVAFMAQKLVEQIAALQREVATQRLRRQERPRAEAPADLYHKLAEHQDYERRLQAMIQDRESLLSRQTRLDEQRRLQQELAALEGRLTRCRGALLRIERQIERLEQGF